MDHSVQVHVAEIARLCQREPFAVRVLDAQMRCMWFNETLAAMCAVTTAEHTGRPFSEGAAGRDVVERVDRHRDIRR